MNLLVVPEIEKLGKILEKGFLSAFVTSVLLLVYTYTVINVFRIKYDF